jgi:hypothetical protein
MKQALEGIERLRESVDTLIVIPNQRLLEIVPPSTSMEEAFRIADNVLYDATRGIYEIISRHDHVNLDFADVRSVMKGMGEAMMGTGRAEGENRAIEAAKAAISSPLLENVSIDGSQAVLVNVLGCEVGLQDTAAAMQGAGIEVERIAEQPSSEGLVATMTPLLAKGDRVLWVRPESARPLLGQALTGLGVELAECRCYRSIPDPDIAGVAADYLDGKYDAAIFASPSAFLRLVEADERIGGPAETRIVALGPVTAAAIARSGAQVAAVAQGTEEQALCGALLALFE